MPGSERIATWALAGLIAVSATACQSDSRVVDPPPAAPSTPTPTPPPSSPQTSTSGASADLDFITPSGNIYCSGNDSPNGVYLECQVSRDRWQMPPLAADECDGDLVSGRVLLVSDGAAELVDCATDAVGRGETQQREYGRPVRAGRFSCVTRESGLRCENTENGQVRGVAGDLRAVLALTR